LNFPSRGTPEFWEIYRALPVEVRIVARKNYHLWRKAPFHPSLHFKKIGCGKWSVRLGIHYMAVGMFQNNVFVWDWIGTHADYDRLR